MKYLKYISLFFVSCLLLYFGYHSFRSRNKSKNSRPSVPARTWPKLRLTQGSKDKFNCKYIPSPDLKRKGKKAADYIEEQMMLLQSDPSTYQASVSRAHANGWTPYEAILQEAEQNLLHQDVIDFTPEGQCQVWVDED